MRHVGVIAARELRSMFSTPVAYALLAAYLFIVGFLFFGSLGIFLAQLQQVQAFQLFHLLDQFNLNERVIAPSFGAAAFVFIFLIPLLSMRAFAEERATGTVELLLTSPVGIWEIVLGKYLAVLGVVAVLVLLTAIYPALLFLYGDPEPLQTLAGLQTLLIYGGALGALASFISSLTRSQIVAAFVSAMAALVLLLLEAVSESAENEAVKATLSYIGTSRHFEPGLSGEVRTEDLAYFGVLIVVFLTLARAALDSLRWRHGLKGESLSTLLGVLGGALLAFGLLGLFSGAAPGIVYTHLLLGSVLLVVAAVRLSGSLGEFLGPEATRSGGNTLLQTGIACAIVGMLAFMSVRYPVKWDWTEAGVHTLAQATIDLLDQVPEEGSLEAYGFFTKGSEVPARRLLDRYAYAGERFDYQIFDPNQRPDVANRFEIRSDGVVVVCGGPCATATGTVQVTELSEQELTRAIRGVLSEQRKVYFLTGHGEGALDQEDAGGYSAIKLSLEAENLAVESLLLANRESVPDDADAVVIAGPTHSLLDRELAALDAFLRGGGALLVLADPIVITNLEGQVREWGVELGADVIVDQQIQLFAGPRLGVQPVVSDYGDHAITEDLQRRPTLFQLARSVRAADGSEVVELALTGDASWAETDLDRFSNEGAVALEVGVDRAGPVAVAAARSFAAGSDPAGGDPAGGDPAGGDPAGGDAGGEGRLVVVGDADFARNRYVAELFNADLFLNMVTWLVGEEEFITIDRKVPRASRATMTAPELATFRFVSLFLLPEAVLLAGILSWWRRRA